MDLNKIFIDISSDEQEFKHVMNLNRNSKLYQELVGIGTSPSATDITYNLIFLKFHAFLVNAIKSKALSYAENQQFIIFLDMEEKDFFFYSVKDDLIVIENISFIPNKKKNISVNMELFIELLKNEPKKIKEYLLRLAI